MKVELERENLFFFASFCLCFVLMQVSTRMAVTFGSETSMRTSHVYSVPDLCSRSASGVYPILLACIIVTFHIDCHHFLIWILWENYFHTSNSNIFHCMNSTTIYYCKLTSKFIFLCFEQPGGDTIQFRRTEGPSLIKLKAGPLRRKKGWRKTMM